MNGTCAANGTNGNDGNDGDPGNDGPAGGFGLPGSNGTAVGSAFASNGNGTVTTTMSATHAAIVIQPPSSVAAGTPFTIEVDAEDANNDPDPTYTGLVTVSLANNPGGSTLTGTLSLHAVNGVATFSDLALHKAGTGYVISAAATGFQPVSTNPFTVTAGSASPTSPAQVVGVQVDGTAWSAGFLGALHTAGEGNGTGYAIPVGSAAQLTPLPWSNVNQIQVAFSEDVNVQQGSLTLTGSNVASYSINGFSYNTLTHIATWSLPSLIGVDKLSIDVKSSGSGAVTDALGNGLDGEWTNGTSNYPSGNGTAGGDFKFAFEVLPGNLHQDGIVNAQDIGTLASHWLQTNGIVGDANGDGIVNCAGHRGDRLALVGHAACWRRGAGESLDSPAIGASSSSVAPASIGVPSSSVAVAATPAAAQLSAVPAGAERLATFISSPGILPNAASIEKPAVSSTASAAALRAAVNKAVVARRSRNVLRGAR